MASQVLKRPLDQCTPEASKRFRHDVVEHYNRQPEVVAAVAQLRGKYGVHEGIITAILETCHYNIDDAQKEIEKFCAAVRGANEANDSLGSGHHEHSANGRKRNLASMAEDCEAASSSNCHPLEPLAEQCLSALQSGVQTPEEARRRLCIVLEPILNTLQERNNESKKIERLTHANRVLYRAYNTLTEKLHILRRKGQEEEEAVAMTVTQLEQDKQILQQEKQVLQWHLDQVNRPDRHW